LNTRTATADPTPRIRTAILEGQLLPNERLIELDLVERFSANRGAIRTALAVLEQQGLVVREPNRGAKVRAVTQKEAVEIMELRAMIESLCARYAALNASDDDIAELTRMTTEMTQLSASGDRLGFSDLNVRFHNRIASVSRHETARQMLGRLNFQIVAQQFRLIMEPGRIEQIDVEHRDLVNAIASRDPAKAEAAMRHHLDVSVSTLQNAIANQLFVRRTIT
jgi:DNA-binding GntR family transcriptional regulator